jgi:hypothetical protein
VVGCVAVAVAGPAARAAMEALRHEAREAYARGVAPGAGPADAPPAVGALRPDEASL